MFALIHRSLMRLGYGVMLFVMFFVAAEVTSRVGDWAWLGESPLANPCHEDLFMRDAAGWHGRPNAQYKKWKMNQLGFRGPGMAPDPPPGTTRVVLLGASEIFGLYESPGKEVAAQLQDLLGHDGRYEVVNAGMTGMSLPPMIGYWEQWVSRFRPAIVVLYPLPMPYLHEVPPGRSASGSPSASAGPDPPPPFGWRFVDRLRNTFHCPDAIQEWRNQQVIDRRTAGKPESWYFRTVPNERLDLFIADLGMLIDAISARGAIPVVMTHAIRATSPPGPDDALDLQSERQFLPRATDEVICRFSIEARARVLAFAASHGVACIDLAQQLNGSRTNFGDLVHFNDQGAKKAAHLVAERLQAMAGDRDLVSDWPSGAPTTVSARRRGNAVQ